MIGNEIKLTETPSEEYSVKGQLALMNKNLEGLYEIVSGLNNKLSSVTKPESPTKEIALDPIPDVSPLTLMLKDKNIKINEIVYKVAQIINRLNLE